MFRTSKGRSSEREDRHEVRIPPRCCFSGKKNSLGATSTIFQRTAREGSWAREKRACYWEGPGEPENKVEKKAKKKRREEKTAFVQNAPSRASDKYAMAHLLQMPRPFFKNEENKTSGNLRIEIGAREMCSELVL